MLAVCLRGELGSCPATAAGFPRLCGQAQLAVTAPFLPMSRWVEKVGGCVWGWLLLLPSCVLPCPGAGVSVLRAWSCSEARWVLHVERVPGGVCVTGSR